MKNSMVHMKNKSAQMKKRITVKIIALILTLFAVSSLFVFGASAETPKYEKNEIEVSLEFGSGSTEVNLGCLTRVLLKVTNNTSEAIKGYAELHWGDSTYYISNTNYLYNYIVDLDLNPGTTKEMLVVIDVVGSSRYFYSGQSLVVDIRNDKNKLLKQDVFTTNCTDPNYIVGWLSDDAQSAEILKRTGNIGIELLTAENFPSDFNVLKDYNFIIVNRADLSASSSYTQKQLDMLKKYVTEGGTLIIGTGADTKILESFKDFFSGSVTDGFTSSKNDATARENVDYYYGKKIIYVDKASYNSSVPVAVETTSVDPDTGKEPIEEDKDYDEESDPKVEWYDPSDEYDTSDTVLSLGNVTLTEITDENFKLVGSSASDTRLYKHNDYELYIANFDFSINALQKSSESEQLIIGLLNRCNVNFNSNLGDDKILLNTYEFDKITNTDVNFAILILILAVYILAGIIAPFIIAKVKRKAKYMLIGIPCAAILFSVFIFSASFIQKGGTTNETTIAFTKIANDGNATSYFTSRTASPFAGSKTVSFGPDAYIYLSTAQQYVSGYDYSETHTIQMGSEMTRKYANVLNWVNTYEFGYQKMQFHGTLTATGSVDPNTGLATLTVKNETGKTIRCAGVFFWNNIIAIGDMNPGEEKTFTDITYNTFSDNCYDLLEEFFYKPNNIGTEDMESDFGIVIRATKSYYSTSGVSLNYYDDPNFSTLKSVDTQSALEAFALYQFITNTKSNYSPLDAVVFGIEDEYKSTIKVNGSDVSKGVDVNVVYNEQRVSATPIVNIEDADSNLDFHPKSPCSTQYNSATDSYTVTIDRGDYAIYCAPLNFDKADLLYGQCEILSKTELADSDASTAFANIIPNDGNTYELYKCAIEKGNTFMLPDYDSTSLSYYYYTGITSVYIDGYEFQMDPTVNCNYWLVVVIPNYNWYESIAKSYDINGIKAKLYLDPDSNYVITYPNGKFDDSIFVINEPEKTE